MKNRIKYRSKLQNMQLAKAESNKTTPTKVSYQIAPKSVSRTRQDIQIWNQALNQARLSENPKFYPLHLLYNEIRIDALLASQIENRRQKCLSTPFIFTDSKGKLNEELTDLLQNQTWVSNLNKAILDSRFYGHSLVEFNYENGNLKTNLIPRVNVDPVNGLVYPDYSEDKFVKYREMAEYNSWILEFGESGDLGLLNSCVPHILYKRFAQSCWSELCEIYGIPPRVMKTNTHDAGMVSRSEKMMRDMGAAAWFIIDQSESFEFAKGVDTNGDVYKNLINLCNNENSMIISGAIIGQDTVNGNRSKDESAQNMLGHLTNSDLTLLEQYWNSTVIPALQAIGVISAGDVIYGYEKTENLQELWKMTTESLQHFDVKPEWIVEKFGIPVEPKKQPSEKGALSLNFGDFFI